MSDVLSMVSYVTIRFSHEEIVNRLTETHETRGTPSEDAALGWGGGWRILEFRVCPDGAVGPEWTHIEISFRRPDA